MEESNGDATDGIPNMRSPETTLQELAKTREEIKKARESAVQAWLDSMPLIEELESSQFVLSRSKRKVTMSSTVVASLRVLLDSISRSVEKKQAEMHEFKASIAQMQEEVDMKHKDKERLKMELAGEEASRSKLKKELEIKCLSVQTSRLSQKALSMEIEALNVSVDNTLRQVKHMKVDHEMIALSHEEYNELCRKANEETKSANSRFRMSEEKRMAMEQRKAKALRKLEALQREKQQREKGIHGDGGISEDSFKAAADADKENVFLEDMRKLHLKADMDAGAKATPLHRKLKETGGCSRRSKTRQRRQRKEKKVRKKQSILKRTKIFFMRLFK